MCGISMSDDQGLHDLGMQNTPVDTNHLLANVWDRDIISCMQLHLIEQKRMSGVEQCWSTDGAGWKCGHINVRSNVNFSKEFQEAGLPPTVSLGSGSIRLQDSWHIWTWLQTWTNRINSSRCSRTSRRSRRCSGVETENTQQFVPYRLHNVPLLKRPVCNMSKIVQGSQWTWLNKVKLIDSGFDDVNWCDTCVYLCDDTWVSPLQSCIRHNIPTSSNILHEPSIWRDTYIWSDVI